MVGFFNCVVRLCVVRRLHAVSASAFSFWFCIKILLLYCHLSMRCVSVYLCVFDLIMFVYVCLSIVCVRFMTAELPAAQLHSQYGNGLTKSDATHRLKRFGPNLIDVQVRLFSFSLCVLVYLSCPSLLCVCV